MARNEIGNDNSETGICAEAVTALKRLFQVMRDLHVDFAFTNVPHNKQYQGTPEPYTLSSAELAGVKAEKGKAIIQSDDAIFRIYEFRKDNITDKLIILLAWAKDQLIRLTTHTAERVRIIVVPCSIVFFSAPRQRLSVR